MTYKSKILGSTALAVMLFFSPAVMAQGEIDFGDDSSSWANDGECDDPRFEGPGAATFLSPVDLARDATDCREAYEAGTVTYIGDMDESVDVDVATDPEIPAPSAQVATVPEIDFGDDSSVFANDGECDDPRFTGPGAAITASDMHLMRDATDCRTALEAGTVTYIGEDEAPDEGLTASDDHGINFGDDSGTFARDGECDDPRFGGGLESHRFADATDCRAAYEAGDVAFYGDGDADGPEIAIEMAPEAPRDVSVTDIDFGDDSGTWANDGECDDPRFGGGLESHRFADATDCRAAYEAGEVTYYGENGTEDTTEVAPTGPVVIDGIDFGDDSGNFSRDGECDDARFTGTGMGASLESHIMADATDCSEAYLAGTITLVDDAEQMPVPDTGFRINYGDDSSPRAFDGVCDDPRFQGRGAALELFDENLLSDATDCRAAMDAGTVTYVP